MKLTLYRSFLGRITICFYRPLNIKLMSWTGGMIPMSLPPNFHFRPLNLTFLPLYPRRKSVQKILPDYPTFYSLSPLVLALDCCFPPPHSHIPCPLSNPSEVSIFLVRADRFFYEFNIIRPVSSTLHCKNRFDIEQVLFFLI